MRLIILLCFLTTFVIADEDRYGNLEHLNDEPIFWCGVIDPYNVYFSILWKVDPKEDIDIEGQWINYIKPFVFRPCRYGNCKSLTITNTKIYLLNGEMLSGLENVNKINFFDNDIDTIENGTFDELSELKELDLSYNSLDGIDYDVRKGLGRLTSLHLNKNPIVLEEDGFAGLSNLELLELTGANITEIPKGTFNGLEQLARLDLSSNNLTSISGSIFERLDLLEELDLSTNDIKTIGNDAFKGLNKLKDLWLNDNKIESLVSRITFHGIDNLENLYLHNNPLLALDFIVFGNMPKVVIEPGFEVQSSKLIEKNFSNSSSVFVSCSHLGDYYTPYNCFVNYRVHRAQS